MITTYQVDYRVQGIDRDFSAPVQIIDGYSTYLDIEKILAVVRFGDAEQENRIVVTQTNIIATQESE